MVPCQVAKKVAKMAGRMVVGMECGRAVDSDDEMAALSVDGTVVGKGSGKAALSVY